MSIFEGLTYFGAWMGEKKNYLIVVQDLPNLNKSPEELQACKDMQCQIQKVKSSRFNSV